jgi:formate hydrogenlyase subunit 4
VRRRTVKNKMQSITYIIVQTAVILLVAPLVNGIIKKVKALTQHRKGAPLLQTYYDLHKLFRRSATVSGTASWVYRAAPYMVFVSALAAAMFVPVSAKLLPAGFAGDAIMFLYVLALGRFFLMLAALDTGSTFGGMGSSREGMIASLIEPAILIALFTIGLVSGSTSVFQMMDFAAFETVPMLQPVYIVTFLAMILVLLAETCRIPVDDPSTHLELTMVHEAMILEYSGRHLALMEYGAVVKQLVFITFIVNIFLPLDGFLALGGVLGIVVSLLLYLAKVVVLTLLVAFLEVYTVKLPLFSVPNLAALAFVLAFIGFINNFVIGI